MKDYTNDIIAQMTSGSMRSFISDGKGNYEGEIRRYGNDNRTFVIGKRGEIKSIIRPETSVNDLFPKWGSE